MKEDLQKTVKLIKEELVKSDAKAYKMMFFVYDTKGVPSGGLTYMYQMAMALKELGYNVQMLYTTNRLADGSKENFIGVGSWLGEKYASLPHLDIEENSVQLSPSDFLFIPEILANVMAKTKKVACKRVVIMNNYDFMTELIPVGASWADLNITDCIASTPKLAQTIEKLFPTVHAHVVRPAIDYIFNDDEVKGKDLIVNIVSKDQNDVNAIVKPFKWKNPIYGFVTFRYLNSESKVDFAKYLKESAITIWDDPFTDFGASALEAMACGNIVIGKIPEGEPEWFVNENDLRNNGLWYYNTREIHGLLASVVQSYIHNDVSDVLKEEMKKTVAEYRPEKQLEDIKDVIVNKLIVERKQYLKDKYEEFNNKLKEEDKD